MLGRDLSIAENDEQEKGNGKVGNGRKQEVDAAGTFQKGTGKDVIIYLFLIFLFRIVDRFDVPLQNNNKLFNLIE